MRLLQMMEQGIHSQWSLQGLPPIECRIEAGGRRAARPLAQKRKVGRDPVRIATKTPNTQPCREQDLACALLPREGDDLPERQDLAGCEIEVGSRIAARQYDMNSASSLKNQSDPFSNPEQHGWLALRALPLYPASIEANARRPAEQ